MSPEQERFIVLRERVRIMRDRCKEEVRFHRAEKERGNLTEDWGECALIHEERLLKALEHALEGSEDVPAQTPTEQSK
jgi:hypothetical protein